MEKEKTGSDAVLSNILHKLIQIRDEAPAILAQPQESSVPGAKRNWRKMGGQEVDVLRVSFLPAICWKLFFLLL